MSSGKCPGCGGFGPKRTCSEPTCETTSSSLANEAKESEHDISVCESHISDYYCERIANLIRMVKRILPAIWCVRFYHEW